MPRQASAERSRTFWNPTISKDWLRLAEAEQLARVEEVLSAFRSERAWRPEDLVAVGVENKIRVLLAFSRTRSATRRSRPC